MTRQGDKVEVIQKTVVVIDICSSTSIIEELLGLPLFFWYLIHRLSSALVKNAPQCGQS